MGRRVHLMTTNTRKCQEYARRLSQYGLEVVMSPREADRVAGWLAEPGVVAVLRERSDLFDPGGERLLEHLHLQSAVNRTTLEVDALDGGGARTRSVYVREIEGHIDLERRAALGGAEDVFNWDDVFVPRATLRSYHEMRRLGLKLSARDLVISDFVRERLWYQDPVQLNWTPVESQRSVDFAVDPVAFVRAHPIYGQRLPASHWLGSVLEQTLAQGLFFRAAKSRREKIYWMPGLNAGVPLTPKRDGVHEATFMFHDLMHFAFPDLLFDGHVDAAHRNAYVVHRMMSEAFTLVLADMVFIDVLKRGGLDYDFTQRRIHPLFVSLGLDVDDPEQLRALLWANTRYCLLGDVGGYEALGADRAALDAFTSKYEQFFVSDYRWTRHNFASMARSMGSTARGWLDRVAPIRAALPFDVPTVGDHVQALRAAGADLDDPASLVAATFEIYFSRLTDLRTAAPVEGLSGRCLERGFLRYMMGQMAAFETFGFLPESDHYCGLLAPALAGAAGHLGLNEVRRLRGFFDQFIDVLHDRRLISDDDRSTFKEVYPMFEPFYVAYDVSLSAPLSQVAADLDADLDGALPAPRRDATLNKAARI